MQIRLTRDDKLLSPLPSEGVTLDFSTGTRQEGPPEDFRDQVREATLATPAIYMPEDPEEDGGLPWIRGPRGWVPVTDPVTDQCDDLCPGLWLHAPPPYPVRKAATLDPVLLEKAVWGDPQALQVIHQMADLAKAEQLLKILLG